MSVFVCGCLAPSQTINPGPDTVPPRWSAVLGDRAAGIVPTCSVKRTVVLGVLVVLSCPKNAFGCRM